jgi:hypothetical protein
MRVFYNAKVFVTVARTACLREKAGGVSKAQGGTPR